MKTRTLGIRLPAGTADRLDQVATAARRRTSDLAREAITRYLDDRDDESRLDAVRAEIRALAADLAAVRRAVEALTAALDEPAQ